MAARTTSIRPIQFNPLMIAMLLKGGKSQTRRPVVKDSRFAVDNILWVKENYWLDFDSAIANGTDPQIDCHYSDGTRSAITLTPEEWKKLESRKTDRNRRLPERFMYKSCSRLFLKITNVRTEKLQNISNDDAIAEGVESQSYSDLYPGGSPYKRWKDYQTGEFDFASPWWSFRSLWSYIYGRDSWDINPEIFVYTFKKDANSSS